jgi:hypothetical protein
MFDVRCDTSMNPPGRHRRWPRPTWSWSAAVQVEIGGTWGAISDQGDLTYLNLVHLDEVGGVKR